MPTFTLLPNERDIYLAITPDAINEFNKFHPTYKPEPITIEVQWGVFYNEPVFEAGFKALLAEYEIIEHYDNLLYIILNAFDNIWAKIQHAYDDYDSKKRARELAQLLLLLNDTPKGKLSTVSFKTLTQDVRVTDSILTDWIRKILTQAIINKDYPLGQFGDAVLAMLPHSKAPNEPEDINYHGLTEVLKKRLINPKNKIKQRQFELCMIVHAYLNGATSLKAEQDTLFSDAQMEFLFDLLVLLKQINIDEVGSEPKDYMRTFLINFI